MIHIIRITASTEEVSEMLQALGGYIKAAVDVNRGILAGGGVMHADCESALLDDGSAREDVWGSDWFPTSQEISCYSLFNIRPAQGNRSLEVQSANLKVEIESVVRSLLVGA